MEGVATLETPMLLGCLQAQRKHVLGILDDLDDEALRRSLLPTGWSCLGMISHLTQDVERFWFRAVVAGEPSAIAGVAEENDAWHVPVEVSAAAALDAYRLEIERADAVIAATPLDAAPAWWPTDLFGDWRLGDLRSVLLHVIVETACHAGHLDSARELIDGRTWLVLDRHCTLRGCAAIHPLALPRSAEVHFPLGSRSDRVVILLADGKSPSPLEVRCGGRHFIVRWWPRWPPPPSRYR